METAFSLALGKRSDPVESTYGYHIIEVMDRREPRDVAFEEVKEAVREAMLNEIMEEQTNELIYLLWESANIEYRFN